MGRTSYHVFDCNLTVYGKINPANNFSQSSCQLLELTLRFYYPMVVITSYLLIHYQG